LTIDAAAEPTIAAADADHLDMAGGELGHGPLAVGIVAKHGDKLALHGP